MPQNSVESLWHVFNVIGTTEIENLPQKRLEKAKYDLKFMGLAKFEKGQFVLSDAGVALRELDQSARKLAFAERMLRSGYVFRAVQMRLTKSIKKREFVALLGEQLTHIKSKVYRGASARHIASWADFIHSEFTATEIEESLSAV